MSRLFRKTADEYIGIFLAIFLVSIAVFSAHASTITGASDAMTRVKAGTLSNHTIVFTTMSGASEGSTMTVTFPTEFGAAGMTENDVDLFDNGLPVTTAPDCSGAEQAAAVWLGNTLSFQICPGDGGSFAPGSAVTILIGTNAVGSGVGANRLTNPAAVGSYRLIIGGSFGDSGFATVAISFEDEIGVTACVGDACNGAPPPPPPPPAPVTVPIVGGSTGPGQTPPPRIIGLVINEITVSTARITWSTDIASNSYVLYGTGAAYGEVMGNDDRVQAHSIVLLGLKPGTTYHAMTRSMGFFGDVGVSADQMFTTLMAKSTIPPQISDIIMEMIGGNEATVIWKTDVPTYWEIDFGRTESYGNEVNEALFDTLHTATIGNLSPNTLYHFQIVATDGYGGIAASSDQTFTTFDTIAPSISLVRVEFISPHSVDIVWQTDKPATGGVKFGISAAYESGEKAESTGYATLHRVSLTKLAAGTLYHFGIFQTDQSDNDAQNNDGIFLTAFQPAAPEGSIALIAPIQPSKNVMAIGSGILLLTVNNVPTGIAANVATATTGSVVGLGLPDELTAKPIDNAAVQVGDEAYKISVRTDGSYGVYFTAPQTNGNVPITVLTNYKDGSSAYSQFNLMIAAAGDVYEVVNDQKISVTGATVTILQNGMPWDGSQYGQNNIQTTDKGGKYSFYLPKGNYSLKIEKNGYISQITDIRQYNGIVSDTIKIAKVRQNLINLNPYWILLLILIILILFEILLNLSEKNSRNRLRT